MPVQLPRLDDDFFEAEALADFKRNVFDALGYVPDDWQRLFHESRARNRLLACGVRVGKTFALTPEVVAAVVCPSRKSLEVGEWVGSRVWCVGPTYDTSDKLFLPAARALKRHFPFLIESYSERDRLVKTKWGGLLQAKSADNPDSLVGEELDAAAVDEAPRIRDHDKEQVKQRLVTRDGWAAYIGSPVPSKWFQREFSLGQGAGFTYEFGTDALPGYRFAGASIRWVRPGTDANPDYFSIRVPTHANRRLSLDVLRDWERNMPERTFRQDVLAEFMSTDGLVFERFEHLAVSDRVLVGNPKTPYVLAWDVARARDYSVVTVLDQRTMRQVFLDRFKLPWSAQYDRVERIARKYGRPHIVVDATGKGDPVADELRVRNERAAAWAAWAAHPANAPKATPEQKRGAFASRIEPVFISTNQIKRDLVENLQVGFDQGLLTILPDPVQMQELRLFEFKQSDATGIVKYGAPAGFHDDTVMALALAYWRCSRPMGTGTIVME